MFQNWGFLLGEIWVLILLAALLGLLAGWLIFGRSETNNGSLELDACRKAGADKDTRIADLQAELAAAKRDAGDAAQVRADLEACRSASAGKDAEIARLSNVAVAAPAVSSAAAAVAEASPEPVAETPAPAADASGDVDYDGDGVIEGRDEGTRPEALDGPRGGVSDDLKMIKGVGPKLEKLCNSLGFYHFDQIANWSADEIAWVDANLDGFKGRVSRDNWVDQAKVLAAGGATEFSNRVKDGDVY